MFRSSLSALVLALGLLLVCTGCSGGGEKKSVPERTEPLILHYALEDNSYSPFVEALRQFAKNVATRTGGMILIEQNLFSPSAVNSDIVLNTVVNTLDLSLVPVNRLRTQDPGIELLGVPFLMQPVTFETIMQPGNSIIKNGLKNFPVVASHLVGLDVWYGGYLQILMRDRPVYSPEDMEGQRFWVRGPGPDEDYLFAMNAEPCEMSFTSGVYAVKHGYLDGIMLPVSMIVSNHLDDYMHYLSITSHARMNYVLLMSYAVWDKLSESERGIVKDEAVKAGTFVSELTAELENIDLSRLRHKGRVKIIEPDTEPFIKKSEYVRRRYLHKYPAKAWILRQALHELEMEASKAN